MLYIPAGIEGRRHSSNGIQIPNPVNSPYNGYEIIQKVVISKPQKWFSLYLHSTFLNPQTVIKSITQKFNLQKPSQLIFSTVSTLHLSSDKSKLRSSKPTLPYQSFPLLELVLFVLSLLPSTMLNKFSIASKAKNPRLLCGIIV